MLRAFDRLRGRPAPEHHDAPSLLLTLPVLERMRPIEGWLSDAEADALLAAAATALRRFGPGPALVEVGSYCGRSTVVIASAIAALAPTATLHAIDPHEGEVGGTEEGIERTPPTLERFRAAIAQAGVDAHVQLLQARSYEVPWDQPIGFLLVDGLHDYGSCRRDFEHFAGDLLPGGLVAFHDYGAWPGVTRYVDELTAAGAHERVALADSLVVLTRRGAAPPGRCAGRSG